MASRTFTSLLAIVPRRRVAASTIVYGLSLAIRFTSATGEEVEIPVQSLKSNQVMSVVTRDGAQLPYADWGPNAAQPMIMPHRGQPAAAMASCPSP